MIAALYARVSTRDKGQNPEMQLEPMRKNCAAVGWGTFKEYIDKAESNDFVHRTAWTQLMKDASLHKFDILLIWKLDRAFRSVTHASSTINMLNSYGIGFKSLMDAAVDTTTPNGMLVFNILAAVAQFEKDLNHVRVNEGLAFAQTHGSKSGMAIGRPKYSIPLQTICSAIYSAMGNYSEAARILNASEKITVKQKDGKIKEVKINNGFLILRLKRAGIAKKDILQNPAQYFKYSQSHF